MVHAIESSSVQAVDYLREPWHLSNPVHSARSGVHDHAPNPELHVRSSSWVVGPVIFLFAAVGAAYLCAHVHGVRGVCGAGGVRGCGAMLLCARWFVNKWARVFPEVRKLTAFIGAWT